MRKGQLAILGLIVAVLGIGAFFVVYTVDQRQQALLLQFGRPIDVIQAPGIHFKMPWQNVEYYDRRILDLDPDPQEVILADQKRINIDSFARYRIKDPLEFRKRAATEFQFRDIFGRRLNSAVRAEVGQVLLGDMLTAKRADVMDRITQQMKAQAPEFGVEVVDVRIGRTDLPEATANSVYNRMRSARVAQAAEIRAIGEEQKLRIQAEADRERTVIIAEAQKESDILRGEGDAAKTNIVNEAYGQDPEFFNFYRSLEEVGKSVREDDTLVINPDSDLFQFFQGIDRAK